MKGIFILDSNSYEKIYGQDDREEISKYVDIIAPPQSTNSIKENMELLKEVEVIFSGWGAPHMDAEFLKAAPNLKAVFYGAGSIKGIVTDAFWDRNIVITSSYAANAIPVTEYTLSQILFCLKGGFKYAHRAKIERVREKDLTIYGGYQSTVGIISLGMIGSKVCELLKAFDVKVIAYDPFVSEARAKELNVKLCTLDDIFKNADVVSLHTPWLKETEDMIRGRHFASMKNGASFINTSRGAVVCEREMVEVLQNRPDLQVVLDVTYPEPPALNSPLYTLPNVVLTPHIAGSMENECKRMGHYMVEELKKYIKDEPLKWQIDKKKAAILA